MKIAILAILVKSQAPVKRRTLMGQLISQGFVTTDRQMRKAVEELVEGGNLIASSEKGYYIITNKEQMEESVNYLRAKSKAIAIRGNCLIRNWREKHAETITQFELF